MQKPLSYQRDDQTDGRTDRQTDVISALYSRLVATKRWPRDKANHTCENML